MSSSPFYMATTALADRSASGGPRVAFTSGVWCDAVVGRYKAEATTVDFKNKAGKLSEEADQRVDATGEEGPHRLRPAAGIRRPDDGHRAQQRHLPKGQLGASLHGDW
ncbi:hypothetical protein OsI_28828 [Oryza sativa Indica Group]|uniref:Uncharacterized protein n=2 Tax=Oryza TaxID=4527 RepID=B8B9T4_ORYSI|nr:hypothetical protein OsI_28828 [Oryza sativa Indica Group]